MSAVLYWTERRTGPNRWQLEEGWTTRAEAESAARYYRQTFRRPCRIVERPRPEGR